MNKQQSEVYLISANSEQGESIQNLFICPKNAFPALFLSAITRYNLSSLCDSSSHMRAIMQRFYRLALITVLFMLVLTPTLAQDTAAPTPPAGLPMGLLLVGLAVLTLIGFIMGSSENSDENSGQ
jgi:hypothetical protein